jgi:hypothetical protein
MNCNGYDRKEPWPTLGAFPTFAWTDRGEKRNTAIRLFGLGTTNKPPEHEAGLATSRLQNSVFISFVCIIQIKKVKLFQSLAN